VAATSPRSQYIEYGELPVPAYDYPFAYVSVAHQAPLMSFGAALRLQNQLHLTPSATTDRAATVMPGDAAPDFDLECTDGRKVSLADFRGKPLILRLTRAVSETFVCPACIPGMEDLKSTYPEFERRGFELAVVMSTTPAQSLAVIDYLGLNYPLYSDPTWDVYRAYGTGHILMATKQAWVVVDGDGVVRWVWRFGEDDVTRITVPMPLDVLAAAEAAVGTSAARA